MDHYAQKLFGESPLPDWPQPCAILQTPYTKTNRKPETSQGFKTKRAKAILSGKTWLYVFGQPDHVL